MPQAASSCVRRTVYVHIMQKPAAWWTAAGQQQKGRQGGASPPLGPRRREKTRTQQAASSSTVQSVCAGVGHIIHDDDGWGGQLCKFEQRFHSFPTQMLTRILGSLGSLGSRVPRVPSAAGCARSLPQKKTKKQSRKKTWKTRKTKEDGTSVTHWTAVLQPQQPQQQQAVVVPRRGAERDIYLVYFGILCTRSNVVRWCVRTHYDVHYSTNKQCIVESNPQYCSYDLVMQSWIYSIRRRRHA